MAHEAQTKTVAALLDELAAEGAFPSRTFAGPLRTGFDPLDDALHGGFRSRDLVLLGGKPGVGKTVAALQWARNMVLDGAHVVFACYEHTAKLLTARLLLLELGSVARSAGFVDTEELRREVSDFSAGWKPLDAVVDARGILSDAMACTQTYADRLWLVAASSDSTGLPELGRMLDRHGSGQTVLFVDYLQKVPTHPESHTEAERMTRVAGGLKELALTHDAVVLAIAASTNDGLMASRQRVHHLRGSSALAYEADVILMLNEKVDAVSKVHLAFDPVKADSFRHLSVFSLEKNRGGPSGVDVEFEKDFGYVRFVSPGQCVAERLVDGRITEE